jgi:hypothetical protein
VIEKEAFQTGMLALCEVFGRKATPELCRVYEAVLGPRLTTEEWSYAYQAALLEERFWPAPAVLLAAVIRRRDLPVSADPEAWQLANIERQARRILARSEQERAERDGRLPL